MAIRNTSFTPELQSLVNCKVASGRRRSASEVVRVALRLLDARERLIGTNQKACSETFNAG
ncbi:type II toxin-antitoxin system ParD family antitoxin [Microvirga makkahensis]|uniref:Uncharacterized protein n=1 Tax=Microvirga makkahensis TaxID=1128670 RepID=A0A7X3MVS5_9HYPH|nr:type II toxin-antitoxin system ParD family antitoxin [Microvirga makkahensis]MXQ14079.1 hypothetical protein [Microvirga makkahensis]